MILIRKCICSSVLSTACTFRRVRFGSVRDPVANLWDPVSRNKVAIEVEKTRIYLSGLSLVLKKDG